MMRPLRKCPWCFVCLLLMLGAGSCTHSDVRIDGSSPEAFERTNAEMMNSLSPSDQSKLVGAELYIFAAAIRRSSQAHSAAEPLAPIRMRINGKTLQMSAPITIRQELNGMTFKGILRDAGSKPKGIKGQVEVALPSGH